MVLSKEPLGQFSLIYFFRDIKLAHSIFALPFVMATLIIIDFKWDILNLFYTFICMVCARSFAMGMNRYLDRNWDILNPRTKMRMIPNGNLKAQDGLIWSLFFGVLFVLSSFLLSHTAGFLSLIVLVLLGSYPLMKNLSWITHWYLGLCLGLSPIATALALSGRVPQAVILLGIAVMMWTAGFDILYSFQDYSFDRAYGLKSAPTRFGITRSLLLSRLSFSVMISLLFYIGLLRESSIVYFIGVALISSLLIWEQWIVRTSNEQTISPKINVAFFNVNASIGIIFFLFTTLDRFYLV
jgi:4-hydroxybenzoate polyprenyltransferase